MFLLLCPLASALTLEAAVQRAAEVDPNAAVAQLEWRQDRLAATEAWAQLGVTPSLSFSQSFTGGSQSTSSTLSFGVGALDPPSWFNAAQQASQARGSGYTAEATALDAQYATALLYYQALAAEAALAASEEGERFAQATSEATTARVAAGLESELSGRTAKLGLLQAQADTAQAKADVAIARGRLSRALEQEVDSLEPAAPLPLPGDAVNSLWLAAAEEAVHEAKWGHAEQIAGIFPSGSLSASSGLPALNNWTLTLGVSWTFDGVVGPFLRAKDAALDVKIAEIERDALRKDIDLGISVAREQAKAAELVAEAAKARQQLADESLTVGQTRLSVGLASSLEVLRLQDEAAQARADLVAAELSAAQAHLEARRLAGMGW